LLANLTSLFQITTRDKALYLCWIILTAIRSYATALRTAGKIRLVCGRDVPT